MLETLRTVVIAHPGARQESLRAFLGAARGIELVGVANGALTGWQLVRALLPNLVIIEGGLPEEEVSLLLHYLNGSPGHIFSLVFASTQRQERAARAAGVSGVVTGNISFDEFGRMMNQMIAPRPATGEKKSPDEARMSSGSTHQTLTLEP